MYRVIIFLISIISRIPLGVHYVFSNILAFMLHHVLHYRYSTVVSNISRSFPELTYKEIDDICADFYHNLADVMVESIWALTAPTRKIGRQVRITGQDDLNKAISLNRNAIIMVGHLGNWEIFTGLPDLRTNYGIDIDNKDFIYVYKKPHSKTAEKVISRLRTKHGSCSIIEAHRILRHIIQHREGKSAFFFICDQNPGSSTSKFIVNFLNQKTYMVEGPESIAARLGMPVLYCGLIRHGRKDNEAHFRLITENASECPEGYVTRTFASLLEQDIKEHKPTWLWSHRRWKIRIQ